jgi:hypothetical protein
LGERGAEDGQFNLPLGIAFASRRQLYVVEFSNDRVQQFAV